MWKITYLNEGKRNTFKSNSEGILSAIEDFFNQGWYMWQIISIERSEDC